MFDDGIKQGRNIARTGIFIETGIALQCRTIYNREIQLLICCAEPVK